MTELSKIKPSHTRRAAMVFIRQSTPSQVEHDRDKPLRRDVPRTLARMRSGSQGRSVQHRPVAAAALGRVERLVGGT